MRPYRVVTALDHSEYSEIVLEHALDHAARQQAPDVHVLTVIDGRTDPAPVSRWLTTIVRDGLENFRAGPNWRTRIHVRQGRPDDEITRLAMEVDADLIVIGHYGLHRRGNSPVDHVITNASCPTLVIGLTEHAIPSDEQCLACVAVRAESEGERLFCVAHSDLERLHLSDRVPWSGTLTRGGGVW